jgi:hypothetical protein
MMGQLALVEVRRLVRNPYLWVVVAATSALLFLFARPRLPNLAEDTITAALATFLIAAALMVIANLATLRDQREGVPEVLAALPGRAEVRTRAVLLATGCLAAVLVVAVIGGYLLIRLAQDSAGGKVDILEVVAAMFAGAIMAVFGVALGRWVPSSIAAPAVLAVLAIGFSLGPLFLVAWLLPVTPPYEIQIYGRPTGQRLALLVTALALLAALAMLRHGRRPIRLGIAAVALAAVVPTGIGVQAAAPPANTVVTSEDPRPGDPELECVERNTVKYCYFPGFARWVPSWARAAEPAAAALPPDLRHRIPVITQSTGFDNFDGPTVTSDGRLLVGMHWGRGEAEVADRARLAGRIAGVVTNLQGVTENAGESSWCDARGQARTVVALWLAGQAAPLRPAEQPDNGYLVEDTDLGDVGYGERELGYAGVLLDRADAREVIWQHWDVLLDPATTIDAALPLLGLPDQFPARPLSGGPPCD